MIHTVDFPAVATWQWLLKWRPAPRGPGGLVRRRRDRGRASTGNPACAIASRFALHVCP